MESPSIWNLLTSSLAVGQLENPHEAWAFLVVQGLVNDTGPERDAFLEIVRKQQAREPMIGPSIHLRVAGALVKAGITRPAAEAPDPWGQEMLRRLESMAAWGPDAMGSRYLESMQYLRQLQAQYEQP